MIKIRGFLLMVLLAALLLAQSVPDARSEGDWAAVCIESGDTFDRVKLRETPGTGGAVRGQYFNGTVVAVLGRTGTWSRVRIGEREGYMMSKFLTSDFERDKYRRYQEGLPGVVRYADTQSGDALPLYETPSGDAEILLHLPLFTDVRVLGTIGKSWLHVRYLNGDTQTDMHGYMNNACVTNTANFAHAVVDTNDGAQRLNLRDLPSRDGKALAQFFCGTRVDMLFDDHVNGDGWARVRVHDLVGYMQEEYLDYSSGGYHSFAPPLSGLTGASAALYNVYNTNKVSGQLLPGTAFSVLCVRGDRYLARIETETRYQYLYAWVERGDVRAVERSPSATGTTRGRTALYWRDDSGAPAAVYTAPAGARVMIGGSSAATCDTVTAGYVSAAHQWMQGDVEVEPYHWYSGVWFLAADIDYDAGLAYFSD